MQIQRVDLSQRRMVNNKPSFGRMWSEHVSWGANYIKGLGVTNFKLFSDAEKVFVEVASKVAVGASNIKERIVNIAAIAGSSLVITKVLPQDDNSKIYPMENKGDGVFEVSNVSTKSNDKYRFIVVDKDNNVNLVKDPYAKEQEDINGWSSIYDSTSYRWKNTDWLEGKDYRRIVRKPEKYLRGLDKLIIEEINIPTLSDEGTFRAAYEKIDKIAKDGIATAIEILPVENTYSLQWGYDGVDKFAPNHKMGGADAFKRLIDYAHGKGLNVIIDMVPNHMGPDGDYLSQTGPYEKGSGQFGGEFNYEGKNNRYVRDFMANAALWWANEFKADGLRLDMTKMCGSDYLLKQIVTEVNQHCPNVFLIAEDGRDNKESVTRYEIENPDHETQLNFIDMQVDFITNNNWSTTPQNIGFDSEWDFRFMHTLKTAVLTDGINLDDFDERIKTTGHRVKYVMSHDEIGNEDGTRLIPKVISRQLDLYSRVFGLSQAEKGQKAAHAAQKLAELVVSKDFENMKDNELRKFEDSLGFNTFVHKKAIMDAFNTAYAKHKLSLGTVMTVPGPKMFFQGDEYGDLSYFKFFREFSGEKYDRATSDDFKNEIVRQKGYDTLESEARRDSIIGKIQPEGMFSDVQKDMYMYNKKLRELINNHVALREGDIVGTFKDYSRNVHIHHLKKDNDEILVIKNFGQGFYKDNYGYYGFPKEGVWEEVLSSDQKEYGGWGHTNEGRTDIRHDNQNLSLAPNSMIVLRRIG